jgi:uncharacterized protein
MSLDRFNLTSFTSLRRIVLGILTCLVLFKLIFSLLATKDRPQIQGKFELYQTNLVLVASEWKPTGEFAELAPFKISLLGADILKSSTEQYQTARADDVRTIGTLRNILTDLTKIDPKDSKVADLSQANLIKQTIESARVEIDKLDLRIGILQAANQKSAVAIETWQKISPQSKSKNTADILISIYQQPSQLKVDAVASIEQTIDTNFDGWFRDRVHHQLYTDLGKSVELGKLDKIEQVSAETAFIKLASIFTSRIIFGLGGVGLIIFFAIRFIIKLIQKPVDISISDLVLENINTPWESPWDWEIVWQVFMVGFFFVGQFLLPFIFSNLINPGTLTTQGQAIYVFSSYALMSVLGIGVLYLSIKPYLPTSGDWFKFQWKSNWFLWGIGGFLVATPIVIVVSLLNEQIWQGKGGSNPLLQIVLEGKNPIALLLFFLTAAVAAPLFEEFMFRGFLLPSLTRYVPVWAAIGISSLIFGVAHLSLSEIIPLTTLGIILGVVYTRTRNLLASMLLHSLWNSSTLISLFILGSGS